MAWECLEELQFYESAWCIEKWYVLVQGFWIKMKTCHVGMSFREGIDFKLVELEQQFYEGVDCLR